MKEYVFGEEPGQTCNRNGCKGILEEEPRRDCSCHINPPCSACTEDRRYCPECGWRGDEEERIFAMNDFVVRERKGVYLEWKPRPLDKTKIDWHSKSHTNSSMIKEGVYPEGITIEEVRKEVNGTFGGRFEYFGNGAFKFIAYTD